MNILRYSYTILKDSDEAKDAVQVIFMQLWKKRDAWLYVPILIDRIS